MDGVHVPDVVLDGEIDAVGVRDDDNDAGGDCEGVFDSEGVLELVALDDGVRDGVPVIEGAIAYTPMET